MMTLAEHVAGREVQHGGDNMKSPAMFQKSICPLSLVNRQLENNQANIRPQWSFLPQNRPPHGKDIV